MWLRYFAVVPLAVACLCAWKAWDHARMRRQAARWPVARGCVVKSSVEERCIGMGDRTTYGPRVVYEFRVKKQTVRAKSLSPEGPVFTSFRERAEREVARFPVGANISVRYDPADPRRCYLSGYGSPLGVWMWAAGAGALAGGAGLIWWLV